MSSDGSRPAARGPRELLWQKAHSSLQHINSRCADVPQLMNEELKDICYWVAAACARDADDRKSGQSPSETTAKFYQKLLVVLSCILGRLLSVASDYNILPNTTYVGYAHAVAQALQRVLVSHLNTDSSLPAALAIAQHLQQADFLGSLITAVETLACNITARAAVITSSSGPAASSCSRAGNGMQGNKGLTAADLASQSAERLAAVLLKMSIQISILWPGGVYKSAAARGLIPASANLAAALAQLSGQKCRQGADSQIAELVMRAAVSTAHRLMIIQQQATEDLPDYENSRVDWNLNRIPQFRQLLFLLLAAQAQLWLSNGNPQQQHHEGQQGQTSALQQLWVALGYAPEQLSTAAATLLDVARSDSHSDSEDSEQTIPFTYSVDDIMRQLGVCWTLLKDGCCLAFDIPAFQPIWQQLLQEMPQAVLLMKVAKQIYLEAPEGFRGDLALLATSVCSFTKCFNTASVMYLPDPQPTESPSAVLPLDDVLRLLLQFLELVKAAQQQHHTTGDGCSSSAIGSISGCNPGDTDVEAQHAVLSLLPTLANFTAMAGSDDALLQQAWLAWGPHVTHAFDGVLRQSISSAAGNGQRLFKINDIVGSSIGRFIEAMVAWRPLDVRLQQDSSDESASSVQPYVTAYGTAESDCMCWKEGILWALEAYNNKVAAGTAVDVRGPDNQARTSRSHQAGPDQAACSTGSQASTSKSHQASPDQAACSTDSQASAVRPHQAEPTSLELQLLSLMTSCCKGLMQTIQFASHLRALSVRTQQVADSVTFAAAIGLQHRAVHLHQSLQHPAVRPWLSLLGKCFVMMGQRLEVLQEELNDRSVFEALGKYQQNLLLHQQHKLISMQLQDPVLELQLQVQQLMKTVHKSTDDVEALRKQLAAAKAQKQKQVFKSLQPELQKRVGRLHDAERAHEAALVRLQKIKQQQQSLQQEISTIENHVQLYKHASSYTLTQLTADLKNSMAALVRTGKVLMTCLAQQVQARTFPRTDASVNAGSTWMSAVLEQLGTRMMPNLVLLEAMMGLAIAASSSPMCDLHVEGLQARVVSDVLEGAGAKWLKDMDVQKVAVADMQTAASRLFKHVTESACSRGSRQCPADLMLPGLLSSELYRQLHEQLVAIGSELITALPHCWCCNNPGCDNLSADSELQLISGKQRICVGCTGGSTDKDINSTAARYCSVECQKQHWKQHKKVCKRLHKHPHH